MIIHSQMTCLKCYQDILKEKRGEYGEQIIATLSQQLVAEFGSGFTARNLANMVRFAEVFQDEKILHTLCAKLNWSHFRLIIYLDDDLKRDFYAEMCRLEGWSVRTLEKKISGMLFERTALSRKLVELAKQELAQLREEDKLTPDLVFRDPYFFCHFNDAFYAVVDSTKQVNVHGWTCKWCFPYNKHQSPFENEVVDIVGLR